VTVGSVAGIVPPAIAEDVAEVMIDIIEVELITSDEVITELELIISDEVELEELEELMD
jgi:hypothetical protein